MCEALKILMKDELNESMEKGIERGNDLILQLKAGASDGELLNTGYSAESIQAAKETLKLILAQQYTVTKRDNNSLKMYRPPKVRPKNLTIGGRYFYG